MLRVLIQCKNCILLSARQLSFPAGQVSLLNMFFDVESCCVLASVFPHLHFPNSWLSPGVDQILKAIVILEDRAIQLQLSLFEDLW